MWSETRVTQILQIKYPIIQGPFGGGLSSARLVAAVSNAGGLGSFGCVQQSPAQIKETANEIRTLTNAPFALNLWVPLPGETEARLTERAFEQNIERLRPYYQALGLSEPVYTQPSFPTFEEQIEAILEVRPPVFSFIYGVLPEAVLRECRKRGILCMGTATHVEEVIALEAAGVDIVIASGLEAGGHRASFLRPPEESPSMLALLPQSAERVQVPLVAAGGISDGRGILAALALGAEGVQIGSAFLACEESNASDAHKAALQGARPRDTLLTKVFSGRYARGIKNQFMNEMKPYEADLPPYPLQGWLTQPIRQAASKQGNPELLALWAGQNAALIRHQKAKELFQFLLKDTERMLEKLRS